MRRSKSELCSGNLELHLVGYGDGGGPLYVPAGGAWESWPEEHLSRRWPDFQPWEFRSRDLSKVLVLDVRLLDGLQALRGLVGVPIAVNSGYRTVAHNRKIEGSPYSQHLLGKAADIVISGMSVSRMKTAATRVPVFERGGIGTYPGQGFIHVDVRGVKARWNQ